MTLAERITLLAQALGADIKAVNESIDSLVKIEQLTQAQYDALATKDANTLYVVVG